MALNSGGRSVSTNSDAAEGAAGGAIVGGAQGAIFGNRSSAAARGAGGGAVIGSASRAGDAEQEKRRGDAELYGGEGVQGFEPRF